MGRRRTVAIASAIVILLMGAALIAGLGGLTRSAAGREWIRANVQRLLASTGKGKVHIGALGGSFLTELTIDSIEIREPSDSLFFAAGPLRVTYDPRDIVDGVIALRSLDVRNPIIRIQRRHDEWSYRNIWPAGPDKPEVKNRSGFGSRISLSNIRIRNGEFRLTLPWTPDDSLHGARRDSAIAEALADTGRAVRKIGPNEYEKEFKWSQVAAQLKHIHLADPDTSGHHFEIARLDMLERFPPFQVHNAQGELNRIGDSLFVNIPRFELPGSNGRIRGKVWWGSDLPMRYDVHVRGDTVSMKDIAWVWNGLPKTGGGKLNLHIKNERDLHVMDYVIENMDVRSMDSRIRGTMTFGVGAPVLIVKDVALEAAPLDFRLIEQFNGKKLPLPWRGAITGTARGRGGPVNRWKLDEGRFTFADANVPGAISKGTMRGELDILFPAFTTFRGTNIELQQLDLRTLQALDTAFVRLNGIVSGRAVLDSSWLDVRFSNGDFTHRDGDAPASHFTGAGRVTWGEQFMTYDVSLAALPLSLTAVGRSYARMPARGEYSGPLRVKGTPSNLGIVADLVGDAGRLEMDGVVDVSWPNYRLSGRGSASGLSLRKFLARDDLPETNLGLHWTSEISGDSLPDLRGSATVRFDRSLIDSVRVYSGEARLRFLAGTLAVDSLRIESAAFNAEAHGRLALASGRAGDSVSFRVVLDSLGGFRRALGRYTGVAEGAARDTSALDGTLRVTGQLSGAWPNVRVDASARGTELLLGTARVHDFDGSAQLTLPADSLRGSVRAHAEGVSFGSVRLNALNATVDLPTPGRAVGDVKAEFANGAFAGAHADVLRSRDSTDVRLDRLRISTTENDWALLTPSRLLHDGAGWRVDSVVLVGRAAGRMALRGAFPDKSEIAARFDASDLPVRDLGELLQSQSPLKGTLALSASLAGTREAPRMLLDASLRDALVAGVNVERATASGRYADRRLNATVRTLRGTVTALRLDAALPVDLSLRAASRRLLDDAPFSAHLRSDSAGVALLETLTPEIKRAQGTLGLDLTVTGTLNAPRAAGALKVTNGAFELPGLGTEWRDVEVDIGFLGDSIALRTVAARSGDARGARAIISGWVGINDLKDPSFDLRFASQGFNVIAKPRVADLDLSGQLRVAGRSSGSTLTGSLSVDRGTINIPDIYAKNLISLDDLEMIDTAALADHGILPRAPSKVIENLTVRDVPLTMGRDVTLHSTEANITLGGQVSIRAARVLRGRSAGRYQLALNGTLQTVRGSYRLNAGPVQRTFDVEGGEVRFRGDPDPNLAELDIRALHTVRTFSQNSARQDVRIRVNIGGTLGSPFAKFSSPDSNRVSDESDILSYLITGGPSNEILGRTGSVQTTAYRVMLSSFGSVIGSKIPTELCSDAQFTTGGLDQYTTIRDVGSGILRGSRFNCSKQLADRVFFRLDAGLCSLGQLVGQGGSFDPLMFRDALGFKLDYRFNTTVSASLGIDPSTSAALCTRDAVVRGFVPTPRQYGFDLFRAWVF